MFQCVLHLIDTNRCKTWMRRTGVTVLHSVVKFFRMLCYKSFRDMHKLKQFSISLFHPELMTKRKSWNTAMSTNYIFHYMAFEMFGAIGPVTARFLYSLASRLAMVTGEARKDVWLFQRIIHTIDYGNAASAPNIST